MKPSNIRYLDNGLVKIMDLGIARMAGTPQITQSGVLMGTMHYMSPEQVQGQPLDGRTDVFSAGCILYEMLTRRVPFSGDEASAVLYKIVWEEPPPILDSRPELPEQVQDILARALAKKTPDRFVSAREMSRELDAVLEVVRKSYPRPKRAFQRELASLEELKRKGEWMRVLPLAEKLSAARPDLVLPARIRREAHRELGRAETDRRRSPEEESRHSAEIADELKMFLVAEPESSDRVGSVPLSQGTVAVTGGSSEAMTATVRGDAESAPAKRGRSKRLAAVAIVLLALIGAALLGRAYLPAGAISPDVSTVEVLSGSPGAASAETASVPEIPEQVIEASSAPPETDEEGIPSQPAPPEPDEEEPNAAVTVAEELKAPIPPEESVSAPPEPKQDETSAPVAVIEEEDASSPSEEPVSAPPEEANAAIEIGEEEIASDAPESEVAVAAPAESGAPPSPPAPEEEEAPISGTLLARSPYPVSIGSVDGPPTAVTRNPVATFSPGRHEVTLLAPDVFLN